MKLKDLPTPPLLERARERAYEYEYKRTHNGNLPTHIPIHITKGQPPRLDDTHLDLAFEWAATSEGYSFWYAVDRQDYSRAATMEPSLFHTSVSSVPTSTPTAHTHTVSTTTTTPKAFVAQRGTELKDLSKWPKVYKKALHYARKKLGNNRRVNLATMKLINCFKWGDTDEGYKFWRSLASWPIDNDDLESAVLLEPSLFLESEPPTTPAKKEKETLPVEVHNPEPLNPESIWDAHRRFSKGT